ncbi:MAG: response regulator [bacterium]|nr:response regulator [bacterium]
MERKKILLVDDSETVLMMEKMVLKASHYELLVAKQGQEAMDKALSEQPDLILLDVVMPIMDGFEVCRKLRAQEATRSIPIIMVTTRGEDRHIACAFEAGCNDYITKPISGLELVSKVSDHLSK